MIWNLFPDIAAETNSLRISGAGAEKEDPTSLTWTETESFRSGGERDDDAEREVLMEDGREVKVSFVAWGSERKRSDMKESSPRNVEGEADEAIGDERRRRIRVPR